MMNSLIRLLGISLFLHPIASSAGTNFACPVSIQVNETVTQEYPSWQVAWAKLGEAERHPLDQMRIYSGNPRSGGNLKPDDSVRNKNQLLTTWSLPQPDNDGYWLACTYENSTAIMVKALPAKLKRCLLTENITARGIPVGIESFVCN